MLAAVAPFLPGPDRDAEPLPLAGSQGTLVVRFGGTIVRIPRDEAGRRRQELQVRLLPVLTGRLPAAVPSPLTVVEPGPGLPFGALAYPLLPGRPLAPGDEATWPSIAGDLAHLLASIHGTPVSRATAAGVPVWSATERMPALEAAVGPTLAVSLAADEATTFSYRWDDAVAVLALHPPASLLCHGDPWYDNLLVDEASGRIVAVLDFEHAVIADVALDLAAVFHMSEAFGHAVVEGYEERRGADASLRGRIAAHRLIREVAGLADAVAGDPGEVPEQVAKIEALLARA
jgi:aminoglycoside phosphotransferase (APT) family kinase protein